MDDFTWDYEEEKKWYHIYPTTGDFVCEDSIFLTAPKTPANTACVINIVAELDRLAEINKDTP